MIRRTILLLGVFALVLASCAGDGDGEPSQTTTPSPSASGQTTTPSPSAGGQTTTPSASAGATAADLPVGAWTGKGNEPASGPFSVQITILECAVDEPCGQAAYRFTPPFGPCRGSLTYRGTKGRAFVFDEAITSGTCNGDTIRLTPTDGTLAGKWWDFEFGTLTVIASATLEPATTP